MLSVDRDGAVALVTLRRPEKRNALSIELREALAGALGELAADGEVACAVLTGEGSAFCAGMDFAQFGGDRAHKQRLVESSVDAFRAVAGFPKPLVAAVNGPALGGGFVLALHADLRVAARSAVFGFPELGRGIPPSYAAALAALPEPLARELTLTGRRMDAEEADGHGMLQALTEDGAAVDAARELAGEIASRPLPALLEAKRRVLLATRHARGALLDDEERALRDALLGE